jgi:hypothetical protein
MYGEEIADDSPTGHTPPEIKEEYLSRLRREDALLEIPTPDDEGSPTGKAEELRIPWSRSSPSTVSTTTTNNQDVITPCPYPKKR